MSELKAPANLTEEVKLPIGIIWAGKTYPTITLRAEMVGDEAAVIDELLAEDPSRLNLDDAENPVRVGLFELTTRKRLRRIVSAEAEDGDKLEGDTLRKALALGLHVADGEVLAEADQRLGKKLPGGSEPSPPSGPEKSPSESSDTARPK